MSMDLTRPAANGETEAVTEAETGGASTPILEPNHVMLDLETLGRQPFCPLLSIGACAFRCDNDETIVDVFFQAITLESCFAAGLRADANTIEWWMVDPSVTDDARKAAFCDPKAVALPLALDAFTDWLASRPLALWGNSARFDLGLLEAAYKACGKEVPWKFYDERCYRTVKNLPEAREIPLVRIGVHHHPAADAVSQAMHLRTISQRLFLHL